jgi:hypothetical protein
MCTMFCSCTVGVSSCPGPYRDDAGKLGCENCHRRLTTCKKPLHILNPGHICQTCYDRIRSGKPSRVNTEPSSPRPAKKQRRSKSDPGKPLPTASTRLRIRAPKPLLPPIKPREMKPSIDPMALLHAAHARRMALLNAESTFELSFGPDS